MKRSSIVIMLALVLLIPVGIYISAQEPCSGEPIEVLNEDPCGPSIWIGVEDSVTICQLGCIAENPEEPGEKCGIKPSWIGGSVVADEGAELGFYFKPSTVFIAEITSEVIQTNLCQMKDDPKYYDGGTWVVPFGLKEIK